MVQERTLNLHSALQNIGNAKNYLNTILKSIPDGIISVDNKLLVKEMNTFQFHGIDHEPLIKVNCSALPENLLESELFDHVKGSFTGATQDRTGRIEAAEGRTLFLDEIGELSSFMQLKLLRFIEAKEYERAGESKTRFADIRLVAAANVDLEKKVKAGKIREDFYYRLNVMRIDTPPLRQRPEDIPLLIDHFVHYFSNQFKKNIHTISQESLHYCMKYPWPGNMLLNMPA